MAQMILYECFGLTTVRQKPTGYFSGPLIKYFGDPNQTQGGARTVRQRVEAGETDIVFKTHKLARAAPEFQRAIVIVRDGRAAVRSFARFRTEISKTLTTIEEVITDRRFSWSRNVASWLDDKRPKLLLRFEDLVNPSAQALTQIGAYMGRPVTGEFTAKVDELRQVRPAYFQNAGNAESVELIEREYGDLFWEHHGDTMRRLGYVR
ncbi:MAG: hypothetical protein AAGM84_02395 [Pseudomonadota bacterium]